MSPEQARGRPVDKRTDIWSFACVLWECLTGKTLFAGATLSDSIGAILHTEPDWVRLPADPPPTVRRLLRRCLAKDPRERLHHIADARIELEDSDPSPPVAGGSTRGYKIAVTVLAVALIASLTVALLSFSWPAADRSDSRGDNPLAGARFSKATNFEGSEFGTVLSPDGRFVSFVSDRDGPFNIFVSQIGTGAFRSLTQGEDEFALEDVRAPVRPLGFTGDGSEIWFSCGPRQRMRTLPLLGGPVRNFLGEEVIDLDWSPDGEHVVYHEKTSGDPVYVADPNGTNSRLILGSPAGMHQHHPIWSVDGNGIHAGKAALPGFLAARCRHDEEPPSDPARPDRHHAHLRHHAGRPPDRLRSIERRLGYRDDRTRATEVNAPIGPPA